jgi:hypothetical protein
VKGFKVPELLRAYGEIFRQRLDGEYIVFAALAGLVLFVVAIVTIGALVETAVRALRRFRERRHDSASPSMPSDYRHAST